MFKIGFSRFLRIFAVAFELGLSYGVMVTRQILVLKFQVRILVAQPNGKPAVQQRVFCVFGGRPSRLGRGGFVRSVFRGSRLSLSVRRCFGRLVFGADRAVRSARGADRALRSVCGAEVLPSALPVPCAPLAGRGALARSVLEAGPSMRFRFRGRPCRALRLRGGGALDRSVLEAGPSMRFRFRGRPCHALRSRGGEASNGSVFGGSRLSLSVRRCFGRLVFGAGRAVRFVRGVEVLPSALPVPCRAAKRRNGGRRVGR